MNNTHFLPFGTLEVKGTIKAALNQPAAKLTNKSEIIKNQTEFTCIKISYQILC